jgi:hypothetical protein
MRLSAVSHFNHLRRSLRRLVFASQVTVTYDKRNRYRRIVDRMSVEYLVRALFVP